jgi:hypothetical protein
MPTGSFFATESTEGTETMKPQIAAEKYGGQMTEAR